MATPTWLKPKFSDLQECATIAGNVARNAGGDASEEEFATMIETSRTSSYFNLKLNSIRAYGLLEYTAGRVRVTTLGKRVITPLDASERESALISAMSHFPVFKALTDRYLGKNEPEKQYVEHALLTDQKAKPDASEWAECFLKSARYAGLFKFQGPQPSSFLDKGVKTTKTFLLPSGDAPVSEGDRETEWLTYPVKDGDKIARII